MQYTVIRFGGRLRMRTSVEDHTQGRRSAAKIPAMAQVSTARKIAIAGRVASRMAGKNRWVRAGVSGAGSVLRSLGHTLGVLWQQVTGVFFLAFALAGAYAAIREYHAYLQGRMGPGRAILAAAFALLFGYFAMSNFARAGRASGTRSRHG